MLAQVTIDSSQFPEAIHRDLLDSLRRRRINPKFHYDSVEQTRQWLALHQAYSPARTDPDCAATYERAFAGAAAQLGAGPVHVVGLGCGGGRKDLALLRLLRAAGRPVSYTPSDVSLAMVLVARQTVLDALPGVGCFPLVCDLATAADLPAAIGQTSPSGVPRVFTFFGLIPNFEPGSILPRLAQLVRPGDTLLFSANLAPGPDYAAGVNGVLPQYDNPLTRAWLMTFLRRLGVGPEAGQLRFGIENDEGGTGLRRITARFHLAQDCRVAVEDEVISWAAGETVRLFFSYRYTPALVRSTLAGQGLRVVDEWITASEEEGVFLVRV